MFAGLARDDLFYAAFNSFVDPHGQEEDRWIEHPEEWIFTSISRRGLWPWLENMEQHVAAGRFPDWDEDTLLDVVELWHNAVATAIVTDEEGAYEGLDRPLGQKLLRDRINPVLARRQPALRLGEDGRIIAVEPRPATEFDVFLSYASEDREVARPLALELTARGYRVFFDEFELRAGDDLDAKIDEGLERAQRGVVILSRAFFAKAWPRRELDHLLAREARTGASIVLPIWHDVDFTDVQQYSPALAARVALVASAGVPDVVQGLERALRRRGPAPSRPVEGAGEPLPQRRGVAASLPNRIAAWSRKRSSEHTLRDLLLVGVVTGLLVAAAVAGIGLFG